ncbi:hypothetical protein MBO_06194 [Moraxella bovoculi 237]|uniref:Uncharacterized protein n=1 Tax=Moraxella bovoculi 237 TaxID=743974 RepID=A0A066ULA6_9GAMM|nr:hypothetical protein MBO_06194 [Moraxella bovoculi 237]
MGFSFGLGLNGGVGAIYFFAKIYSSANYDFWANKLLLHAYYYKTYFNGTMPYFKNYLARILYRTQSYPQLKSSVYTPTTATTNIHNKRHPQPDI